VEWAKRPPPVVRTLSNIARNSLGWRSPHWVKVVAVADSNCPDGSHSQVHTLVAVVGSSPHAHSMRRMALDTLLSGSGFPASGRWDTSV